MLAGIDAGSGDKRVKQASVVEFQQWMMPQCYRVCHYIIRIVMLCSRPYVTRKARCHALQGVQGVGNDRMCIHELRSLGGPDQAREVDAFKLQIEYEMT